MAREQAQEPKLSSAAAGVVLMTWALSHVGVVVERHVGAVMERRGSPSLTDANDSSQMGLDQKLRFHCQVYVKVPNGSTVWKLKTPLKIKMFMWY